jgi:hypothetical protein
VQINIGRCCKHSALCQYERDKFGEGIDVNVDVLIFYIVTSFWIVFFLPNIFDALKLVLHFHFLYKCSFGVA